MAFVAAPGKKARKVTAPGRFCIIESLNAVDRADRCNRNKVITQAVRKCNLLLKPEVLSETLAYPYSLGENLHFRTMGTQFLCEAVPRDAGIPDDEYISKLKDWLTGPECPAAFAASRMVKMFPSATVEDVMRMSPYCWKEGRNMAYNAVPVTHQKAYKVLYSRPDADVQTVMSAVKNLVACLQARKTGIVKKTASK